MIVANGQRSPRIKSDVFTLGLLNKKFYVTTTEQYAGQVHKSSKALSFRPFLQQSSKTIGHVTDSTFELMGTDFVNEFSKMHRIVLAPGPHLDRQNLRTGEYVLKDFETLSNGKTVHLLQWVRSIVMQATSCGVFGAEHPFRNPEVRAAFW